jgi:cytochrome oxidase Cu insertion factor (SCO1/SenC/PrrC family)
MHTVYLSKFILSIFLLNLFNITLAFPQEGKQRLPTIHVYEEAPDFVLKDLSGKEIKLSAFRGKKKVVLVFYRGWVGYW